MTVDFAGELQAAPLRCRPEDGGGWRCLCERGVSSLGERETVRRRSLSESKLTVG